MYPRGKPNTLVRKLLCEAEDLSVKSERHDTEGQL